MYFTGLHAIEESIKSGRKGTLYRTADVKNKRALRIIALAKQKSVPSTVLSLKDFEALVGKEHRKIAFQTSAGELKSKVLLEDIYEEDRDKDIIIILDGVSDPHNLGAVIRSADQFGASAVICPKDKSAKITATTSQSAAGADAYVPVFFETNISRVVDTLKKKGYWVYAADMEGESLQSSKFSGKVALIMGAEGRGVSRLLLERADMRLSITTMGHVDSLNVSVAAGVLLYEVRKQLGF